MAAFAQVEATDNVSDTVTKMSAKDMIGQYVTVNHDGEAYTGVVDYVTQNNGEYYVCIGDTQYKASEVVTIHDTNYYEANIAANTLRGMIGKLPAVENLTADDEEALTKATTLYNSFSDYTRSFLQSDEVTKLESLAKRMSIIKESEA